MSIIMHRLTVVLSYGWAKVRRGHPEGRLGWSCLQRETWEQERIDPRNTAKAAFSIHHQAMDTLPQADWKSD